MKKLGGVAILVLLLLPLSLSLAQLLHARSLAWGDDLWPGYAKVRLACAAELRLADVAAAAAVPGVGVGNAGASSGAGVAVQTAKAAEKAAAEEALVDDLLGDDLLGDDPVGEDAAGEDATGEDAVGEGAPAKAAAAPVAAAVAVTVDAAGGAAAGGAAAGGEDDLLDGIVGDDNGGGGEVLALPVAAPVRSALAPDIQLTDGQRAFCKVERTLSNINQEGVGWMPIIMAALLLIAAIIATMRRHHISLRSPRTPFEDRVSSASQLVANATIALSAYFSLDITSGHNHLLQQAWIGGTGLMVLINVFQLAKPVQAVEGVKSGWGRAIAAIPLYAWMTVISGLYFFGIEHHPPGISIFLQKITEFSILYIQVGLYLWTGMMLRDTSLGQLFFDIVRPLRLPPELFAVFVVLCAAVPTAYSGASGILVLALGATIFTELRRSGLSQQRSLAATAMSGSLGVVLPPCLLVVIVASLNLDVTTDELFYWGWRVFGLSVLIFAAISFAFRTAPWRITPAVGASGQMAAAGRRLVPYLVIAVVIIVFYDVFLNAGLDEHTAPYVLPVVMLALLPWDRLRNRRAAKTGDGPVDMSGATRATLLDTGTHIGALLMLMGLSACLGGVIERSNLIELFSQMLGPASDAAGHALQGARTVAAFDSPYTAMCVLMVALVLIGMVMDPYGAVILVSVTLYPLAKDSGIHPLNFWMVALCSFELGYLSPPVALNHLLTRQVVSGLDTFDEEEEERNEGTFYQRNERILLPVFVMVTTLLIVAFGPLLYGVRAL